MLINQNKAEALHESPDSFTKTHMEKMKFDDIILNQFDEDLDADADGSELFSLINQSLDYFNQSVHSSNNFANKDLGRDSAYETIVSSLSTQNDDFLLTPLSNLSLGKGGESYRLNFREMMQRNQRHLPYGGNSLNESTSFNEKFLRGFPQNFSRTTPATNRQRLQSSSSACDPLITGFVGNGANHTNHNLSSNSIQAQMVGSPDQSVFPIDFFNSPESSHLQINNGNLSHDVTSNYTSRNGYALSQQQSEIFSQLELAKRCNSSVNKQKLSKTHNHQSHMKTLRSNSSSMSSNGSIANNQNYPLNSFRSFENGSGSHLLSPSLSSNMYSKSQTSTNLPPAATKKYPTQFNHVKLGNKSPQSVSSTSSTNTTTCTPTPAIVVNNGRVNGLHQTSNGAGLALKDFPPNNGSNANRISKGNRACSFYLRGHCKKRDCEFAHDLTQVTCRFWEYGSCLKGNSCPFLHGYPPGLSPQEQTLKNQTGDIDLCC